MIPQIVCDVKMELIVKSLKKDISYLNKIFLDNVDQINAQSADLKIMHHVNSAFKDGFQKISLVSNVQIHIVKHVIWTISQNALLVC